MNKKDMKVEDLDVDGVLEVLRSWDLAEFQEFVQEKQIDGRKLLGVGEGIVKLWRPRAQVNKFMEFIADIKRQPDKYLETNDAMKTKDVEEVITTEATITTNIEAQYQTVSVKKVREQLTSTSTSVEEILKKIVPPKSFLYRNQPVKTTDKEKPVTSYVPMDAATDKKPKRFFRLSYEYPHFDVKQLRFMRSEHTDDRGYYSVKNSKYYAQKSYKKPESRKYRSLSTTEELEKYPEEHFYEDLNYYDIDKQNNDTKELNTTQNNVKPTMVKIQELFQSFKLPFFKKAEEVDVEKRLEDTKISEKEKDGHIYENSDSLANMYDSIHVSPQDNEEKRPTLPVEEYLEPVQLTKDYCDVGVKRDDSILGYILSIFDSFSMRRETSDVIPEESEDHEEVRKVSESPDKVRTSMADRPLPVPVENEPYYMDIDRSEAENLLRGQPDGTFVLRPSSQPNHAYTLTVSCSNQVHNIGVRRRPDGRLALGFARKGERSFASVTSLLRHHKKRRLLLVAGGGVCGATTLNDTPQYYQTPSSLPLSD